MATSGVLSKVQACGRMAVPRAAVRFMSGPHVTARPNPLSATTRQKEAHYEEFDCGNAIKHINRNPRSPWLEGEKKPPPGFQTSSKKMDFVHRLRLTFSGRFVKADVDLGDGAIVLSTNTQEWHLERQLYSTVDKTAARVVGEVMAQRLLESGITRVYWDIGDKKYHGRVKEFIDAVVAGGISFE